MSLGYAENLSYRDDVGAVGQKEHWDEDTVVAEKCKVLAEMVWIYPAPLCGDASVSQWYDPN
jgi:hypothetical protein